MWVDWLVAWPAPGVCQAACNCRGAGLETPLLSTAARTAEPAGTDAECARGRLRAIAGYTDVTFSGEAVSDRVLQEAALQAGPYLQRCKLSGSSTVTDVGLSALLTQFKALETLEVEDLGKQVTGRRWLGLFIYLHAPLPPPHARTTHTQARTHNAHTHTHKHAHTMHVHAQCTRARTLARTMHARMHIQCTCVHAHCAHAHMHTHCIHFLAHTHTRTHTNTHTCTHACIHPAQSAHAHAHACTHVRPSFPFSLNSSGSTFANPPTTLWLCAARCRQGAGECAGAMQPPGVPAPQQPARHDMGALCAAGQFRGMADPWNNQTSCARREPGRELWLHASQVAAIV